MTIRKNKQQQLNLSNWSNNWGLLWVLGGGYKSALKIWVWKKLKKNRRVTKKKLVTKRNVTEFKKNLKVSNLIQVLQWRKKNDAKYIFLRCNKKWKSTIQNLKNKSIKYDTAQLIFNNINDNSRQSQTEAELIKFKHAAGSNYNNNILTTITQIIIRIAKKKSAITTTTTITWPHR